MLRSKEEIKKSVLDYLINRPRKTRQVEEYTASRISEVVKANISKVEEAITELEQENLLDSRKVHLDVYVPKTEEGSEVLTVFARRGYIAYSPYWAMSFGIGLLFIGLLIWGNSLTLPTQATTLFESYLLGIRYGIFGSFVVGLIGGQVIQNMLSKFRRWQIISEKAYEIVSSLFRYTAYVFVALFVIYYIVASQLGSPLDPSLIVALLAIATGLAVGYKQIQSRGS